MRRALKPPILFKPKKYALLTLSGNEITDAMRAVGTQGDGRLNDSSYGIWAAATNLCTNGGFETNLTGWANGANSIVSRDPTASKFGAACGKWTSGAAGVASLGGGAGNAALSGATAGLKYTFSFWYRGSLNGNVTFQWNESGGAFGQELLVNGSITPSAAWQRATFSGTVVRNDRTDLLLVIAQWTALAAGEYLQIDGFQIETGSVATPYVHTDGGTATRAAARVQAPASIFNATQGWVAMRVRTGFASTTTPGENSVLFIAGTDANNYITGFWAQTSPTFGLFRIGGGLGGASAVQATPAFAVGSLRTVVFAWTATALTISIDGAAFTSAAQSTVPAIGALLGIGTDNGVLGAVAEWLKGDILWFACGTGTLTDGDAATIGAFGNSDVGLQAFPGNPTGFWPANNGFMEVAS